MTVHATEAETASRFVGRSVRRREDRRLVTGEGRFVDDVSAPHMGYVHFVRSPHAHAAIRSIDTSRAEALDGVYATLTGREAAAQTDPLYQTATPPAGDLKDYCLAVDKARYMGDAVAAVLASSRELARDAAELIEVDYEPLEVVRDPVAAADPSSPVLHAEAGTNVAFNGMFDFGDFDAALAEADHVVTIDRLDFHRFSSTPLECLAVVIDWDQGTDTIDVEANNQMPMMSAMLMSGILRIRVDQMNWHCQDIGGGFGVKIPFLGQMVSAALLSKKAGRPAKWTETRTEHLQSCGHGSSRTFLDVQIPVKADGTLLGFGCRAFDDAGAYLHNEPMGAAIWAQALPGPYHWGNVRVDFTQTMTNKCPSCANRGYSRMQHTWMIERAVDIVAHKLGFDPVELRRKNYVQPEEYPWEGPSGTIYDSGDLPQMLDKALALIDYDAARAHQAEVRASGARKRIGIGIGTALDPGTNNFGQGALLNPYLPWVGNSEVAIARLELMGEVSVSFGSVASGQGHETTAAQVVADILGITPDDVVVQPGFAQRDGAHTTLSGTIASQFAVTGVGAITGAAQKLRDEIVLVATLALQAPAEEIELANGMARVVGQPERAIPFIGVANMVHTAISGLPPYVADNVTLNCRHVYRAPLGRPDPDSRSGRLALTYASQVHAAVIEIDEDTGQIKILDYAVVDECGNRMNPQIVEGQVHGAVGHGVGASLYETFDYDDDGQLGQASFMDYHAATALDVPRIKTDEVVCPSPFTVNGAKGMGEGGGTPLMCLSSAVQDALGSSGSVVVHSHNDAARVWRLLHEPQGDVVHVTSR
jgi:2-furoyl-CoA dehydrogenase large subunit